MEEQQLKTQCPNLGGKWSRIPSQYLSVEGSQIGGLGARTQITAVNQKLLPGIYFSPENVPFAQKREEKSVPGRVVTKK